MNFSIVEGDSSASPRNDRIKEKFWGEEAAIRKFYFSFFSLLWRIAASSPPLSTKLTCHSEWSKAE
jgi:hypothetical protein